MWRVCNFFICGVIIDHRGCFGVDEEFFGSTEVVTRWRGML